MKAPAVVTIPEAVALLSRVEPRVCRDLTDKRFRYAAEALGIRATPGSGAAALYTAVDVALVRLVFRLYAEGVSQPMARAAAVYLGPEVRRVIESGRLGSAVIVVPVSGPAAKYPQRNWARLVTGQEARTLGGVQIAVRDLAANLVEGMREIRVAEPCVWQWRSVPASTAALRMVRDDASELVGV